MLIPILPSGVLLWERTIGWNKYPEYIRARSQDLEKQYHDAGQFYIYQSEEYLRKKGMIAENIMPLVLSELEVQDIDNEEDWKLAELKYLLVKGKENFGE